MSDDNRCWLAEIALHKILNGLLAFLNDPATTDPENDGVIRRTSGETSSSGDTTTRRTMPTGG